MSDTPLQFAQSVEYQYALLAKLLSDPVFRDIAKTHLTGQQFSAKPLQWAYNTLIKAPIPLTPITFKEEFILAVRGGQIKEQEVDAYVKLYETIKKPPAKDTSDYIESALSDFIKTQNIKNALMQSLPLIETGDWSQIESIISKAVNSGADIMNQGQKFFSQHKERIARRVGGEETSRVATGIAPLDAVLYGGLKAGQVGLIVGGTGRGKTVFLSWLSKAAIITGKKVVYFTLEMDEDSIASRFDSMFCRIKPQDLTGSAFDNEAKIQELYTRYGDSLIIKKYHAGTAPVSTLKSFLLQLNHAGFNPDVVIVDYLDIVKAPNFYGDAVKEMNDTVVELSAMAQSMNTRIWTASQLNRSGLVAETPDESGIAGAIAKLFTVDVALFMAQTAAEREDGELRIQITKSRLGPAGKSIKINTDYSFMTFYRPDDEVSANTKKVLEAREQRKLEVTEQIEPTTGEVFLV